MLENLFGEMVYSYTREQAIKDGNLVDVSEMGKEAGFNIPVAITRSLHSIIEDIPPRSHYQSYQGRLWDILFMGNLAARNNLDTDTLYYKLILTHGRNKYITLKMVLHGGDNGEPVITIMLSDED